MNWFVPLWVIIISIIINEIFRVDHSSFLLSLFSFAQILFLIIH
jgi:hypothetical protein